MIIWLLTLFSFTFPTTELNIELHEFHLSRSEVFFNEEAQSLEISLHLFIDDLELALKEMGHDSLKLCTSKESERAEEYLWEYINRHFQVEVDGARQSPNWVGKEISEDLAGIWCYIEITSIGPSESITIHNDILVDVFADQRNIVKVEYDKGTKGHFLLDKKSTEGTLKIQ